MVVPPQSSNPYHHAGAAVANSRLFARPAGYQARMYTLATIFLLTACSPQDGSSSDKSGSDTNSVVDTSDTATAQGSDTANDVNPDDLYGVVPNNSISAPQFTVVNHDGSTRTREDLMGHRTVMWFFPFARTPG
ncbi:MAG: hypothetical protein VX519_10860 [Myxococcota bacterium]|nr:hypothetical protein [Myxococcota bacterium]